MIISLKNYINFNLTNRIILKNIQTNVFNLLNQLTTAEPIDTNNFIKIVNQLPENHYIYIYLKNDIPIGIITLIIEQKLIHQGKCVGHIEDLVVDKNNNGKGIAKQLINHCIDIAKANNCYKIILDCKESLEPFYNKLEFKKQGICMRKET